MLTNKFTPLQIRRMERASRAGRKEKKRIAKVSTHRSSYRWSSDPRHETRVFNAKPVEKFSMENALNEFMKEERAEELEKIEQIIAEENVVIENFRRLRELRRDQERELKILFENSFDSEEFKEKFFETVD